MKLDTLTDAIGMIDDDLIVNAVKERSIRQKRRRLPVIAAAVAAAVCLTVGASALAARNTHLLDSFFGNQGADQVSMAELPAPVVYETGDVTLTVETEIDDGMNRLYLISAADKNGNPPDFMDMMSKTVHADGSLTQFGCGGFGFGYHPAGEETAARPEYLAYFVEYADREESDCFLTFRGFPDIRIPIQPEQNTPVAEFSDGSDTVYRLSCFELVYTGKEPPAGYLEPVGDPVNEPERWLIYADGTKKQLDNQSAGITELRDENGNPTGRYRAYYSHKEYLDISDVTAVEIGGTVYPRK